MTSLAIFVSAPRRAERECLPGDRFEMAVLDHSRDFLQQTARRLSTDHQGAHAEGLRHFLWRWTGK